MLKRVEDGTFEIKKSYVGSHDFHYFATSSI